LEFKEQRKHQRFRVADQNIHAKIASARKLQILDISIGGALLQTDTRLDISKEYTIRIEHNGKFYPIKGSIVWSVLKECKRDQQGNSIPIYRSGMKFFHVPEEFMSMILSIGTHQKKQISYTVNREKYPTQSLDTSDISGIEKKHLESHLSPLDRY
jgi:hypothetical protein